MSNSPTDESMVWIIGFKSKSSRSELPLLTWYKRSDLPTTSSREEKPSDPKISLTSSAIKLKRLITYQKKYLKEVQSIK